MVESQTTKYRNSSILGNEFWAMFLKARNARQSLRGVDSIRRGTVLSNNYKDMSSGQYEMPMTTCGCDPELNESCGECEPPLDNVCLDDVISQCHAKGLFDGIARLLTMVKLHEFTSSVENAYAGIGNKPHQLKRRNEPVLLEDEINSAARAFYDYLQAFLDKHSVRIDELLDIFDVPTLTEVRQKLIKAIRDQTQNEITEALSRFEGVLGDILANTNFVKEYMRVIEDTKYYPLGVLWCDGNTHKKKKIQSRGKLKIEWDIQSTARRVDPCYFWVTEDWTLDGEGSMCFRLKQYSRGDLQRMEKNFLLPKKIKTNLKDFLDEHEHGHRIYAAGLFSDDITSTPDKYDVLIARGIFSREALEEEGIEIPNEQSLESHCRAEVLFSGNAVLGASLLPYELENLGVYITTFRRNTESVWGIPLVEFVWPFAKLYEGTIKSMDIAVGKSVGSIISLDMGVIEDIDNLLVKNEETGAVELDFSEDIVIPFDSTNALGSPNFKGIPLHVHQLPSDLDKIIPVLNIIFQQLEAVTGIKSMIHTGVPNSSAIRTNSLYQQAYSAASKPLRSILRFSERQVMQPALRWLFDYKLINDGVPDTLIDVEPQILLSDELNAEIVDDEKLWDITSRLAEFRDLIPDEKYAALINELGREIGLDENLIDGINPISGKLARPVGGV